jgi:hypothetical protein
MTDDDGALARKVAAVKALNTEADELFCFLASIESEEAMKERTAARADVFRWVMRQPRHDKAARAALWASTK